MKTPGAARVTIVGIDGTELDLSWLQGSRIPAGVRIEIADAGERLDLVVSRGDEHVALVIDDVTGETLAEERRSPAVDLIELAHSLATARKSYRTTKASSRGPEDPSARILFRSVNWPFGNGRD
ncbi:hypothetical protein ACTHQN_05935 [Curtobacterium flaccumfaciens]|uniref:hypothetical protein n=1 Tax=Curtobacterium TaxID=2034 RepID=UPI001BE0F82C|nr:hypothetical protein [Curtobacterium flaccumfaciens]MBT1618091.1 hypothetical protein [Curtobacterium flaccumfaciens pv. poinsettiae]